MTTQKTRQPQFALSEELTDTLLPVAEHIHDDLDATLNEAGLTLLQFDLLMILKREEQLDMTLISRELGHTTAATTGLMDRLISLGYVIRTRSKEDRRRVFASLSKKGKLLIGKVQDSVLHPLVGEISAREVQLLSKVQGLLEPQVI